MVTVRVRVSTRVSLVQLLCGSSLENNVAPSTESNGRGHSCFPYVRPRKFVGIAILRKTAHDFRGHSISH